VFPFVLKAALTGKFMANAHGTFSTWWQQEKLMRSFDNFPFSLVACSSSSTTASIDKTQQLQQQKFQTWLLHNAAAEEFHPIKRGTDDATPLLGADSNSMKLLSWQWRPSRAETMAAELSEQQNSGRKAVLNVVQLVLSKCSTQTSKIHLSFIAIAAKKILFALVSMSSL